MYKHYTLLWYNPIGLGFYLEHHVWTNVWGTSSALGIISLGLKWNNNIFNKKGTKVKGMYEWVAGVYEYGNEWRVG